MKVRETIKNIYPRRAYFPYLILVLGLLVTTGIAVYLQYVALTKEQLRFQNEVESIHDRIHDKLDTYITVMRTGAGLFDGSSFVSKSDFHAFASRLELRKFYPGLQAVGYAEKFTQDDVENMPQILAQAGVDDVTLYPNNPRSEYYPVIYIEPEDKRNQVAKGYDMFTNPVRRKAMEQARDTGEPAASGKVTLVQEIDQNKQAGFLIYTPVYQKGVPLKTVAERRAALEGFMYGAYRVDDLLQGIFGRNIHHDIDFAIYDGRNTTSSNLLYLSDHKATTQTMKNAKHSAQVMVSIAGTPWTMSIFSNANFADALERNLIPFIVVFGIAGTLALFYISRSQYSAQSNLEKSLSDLRRSRDELRLSEQRYRLVVESVYDLISLMDLKGNVLYASPSFTKILGYAQEELQGKNLFTLVAPEDVEIAQQEFKKVLGGAPGNAVVHIRNKHGEYRIFEASGTAIVNRQGRPYMVVAIAHDITERTEVERRKDEFIGIASHELKTPVTSIKAFAQILQRDLEKEGNSKAVTFLTRMNVQIDNLTQLITDLLNLSKIQAGKLDYQEQPFDLNQLTDEIVENVQATTETHKIYLKNREVRQVCGDQDRIGQVLINLLTNAIKYSPDGEKIDVEVTDKKTAAQIAVKDYGIGISPEQQRRIFDRFYQANGSAVKRFPGLGIGLYISSEIISRHGGKIWVSSKKGRGSTFFFTLPYA